MPSRAAVPSAVAPLKPSTGVHTASPEISAGYAKYRNARADQRGVEKILAGSAKYFLADHDAES